MPQQETRLQGSCLEEEPDSILDHGFTEMSVQPEAGQLSGLMGWGTVPLPTYMQPPQDLSGLFHLI